MRSASLPRQAERVDQESASNAGGRPHLAADRQCSAHSGRFLTMRLMCAALRTEPIFRLIDCPSVFVGLTDKSLRSDLELLGRFFELLFDLRNLSRCAVLRRFVEHGYEVLDLMRRTWVADVSPRTVRCRQNLAVAVENRAPRHPASLSKAQSFRDLHAMRHAADVDLQVHVIGVE